MQRGDRYVTGGGGVGLYVGESLGWRIAWARLSDGMTFRPIAEMSYEDASRECDSLNAKYAGVITHWPEPITSVADAGGIDATYAAAADQAVGVVVYGIK